MNIQAMITERSDVCLIKCYVQPSASKTALTGIHNGALKFSLAAPPTDGKANKALCVFIAKQLKIAKSAVKIYAGEKSRSKTVSCSKCTGAQIKDVFENGIK